MFAMIKKIADWEYIMTKMPTKPIRTLKQINLINKLGLELIEWKK